MFPLPSRPAILTLLTAALKLQGADAQNHAVYAELKRVQQYFGKIKAIEEPAGQRTTTVNQEAAARILKADLVSILQKLCAHCTQLTVFQERQQGPEQQTG